MTDLEWKNLNNKLRKRSESFAKRMGLPLEIEDRKDHFCAKKGDFIVKDPKTGKDCTKEFMQVIGMI